VCFALTETKVPCAQSFERDPIGPDDVSIEGVCGRHEPGVVLSHAARGAALQEGTPPRLCQVQSLYGKALQRRERCRFVGCALEDFFYADDRDHDLAAAQRRQELTRRTVRGKGRFTFERDEKRRVEQDRAAHGFACAHPSPLPADCSTQSIRSSPVSIGPARSINARITSDLGTLLRLAQRARRAARFLSSLTVIVGMVIPRYYHARTGFTGARQARERLARLRIVTSSGRRSVAAG